MNDIETLEEIKNIFIHLKNYGWINDIKRDVNTDNAICAIENLINRNKELEKENLHWRGQYHLLSRRIGVISIDKIDETITKIQTGKIKIYPNSDPSFAAINILERLKGEE